MARGCVTVITVLSFVLLVLSVLFFVFVWPEQKKPGTALVLQNLDKAVSNYRADFGKLPPVDPRAFAAALLGENERKKTYLGEKQTIVKDGRFVDYWRRPLLISAGDADGSTIVLSSAGPDGVAGNDDDLRPEDVWKFFPGQEPREAE